MLSTGKDARTASGRVSTDSGSRFSEEIVDIIGIGEHRGANTRWDVREESNLTPDKTTDPRTTVNV